MSAPDAAGSWTRAARTPCPPPEALLLTVATLLGAGDAAAARAELDDQSRLLFGLETDPSAAVTRLAGAFEHELGYRPDRTERSALLSLPQVVEHRTGHPLILAVVAVALLRGAGLPGTVCHASGRWLAGVGRSPMMVLDLEPGNRPADVRPLCGHLVAMSVLNGLGRAYEAEGRPAQADACERLKVELPTVTDAA